MRLLYHRRLVQVRGGNASIIDRDKGIMYISASGLPRHLTKPEDTAVIRMDGTVIRGNPSSEWRLHAAIYQSIPEAKAIVHAHPLHTITVGELGLELKPEILSEAMYGIGCVTTVDYIKPGTWELAREVAGKLASSGCHAAIMKRHGAVVYSDKSIYHALDSMEALEDLSRITLYLHTLRR